MKIGLDVKNPKKAIKPNKSDLIVYDGKEWYVTTKEELYKDLCERLAQKEKELAAKVAECDEKIAEVNKLKVDVAKQLLEFGEIVTSLVSKEGK